MTLHLTIDLRAVLIGFVLLLVAGGIATPFAISLADDGPAGDRVSEQRAVALGTAFTYQGRLDSGAGPATGTYDLRFRLYEDIDGATALGTGFFDVPDVPVTNGLFTATLDFGASPFAGQARFLEVRVRPGAETGGYTVLTPLQRLSPTPYALYANTSGTATNASTVPWTGLTGVPAGFADGSDNDVLGGLSCANGQVAKLIGVSWSCAADNNTTYTAQSPIALISSTTFGFDTTGCVAGEIWKYNGTAWNCEPDAIGWSLTGNASTTGANFLGTTDNTALELRANGQRALRIEPNATSPNMLGGYSGNVIAAGVYGGTIGGGGTVGNINRVISRYGTVGGGYGNTASGTAATVGGGFNNTASGGYATVLGGSDNTASGTASTVGGGFNNTAQGVLSFAAGIQARVFGSGSFLWADGAGGGYRDSFANNTFEVYAAGGIYFAGNLTVSGCYCGPSDVRLKQDVAGLRYGLDTVKELRPVEFRWKDGRDDFRTHLGLLAQEVEPIIPEAVYKAAEPDGTLSINSPELIPVLIKAIQEQQTQIETLKDRVGGNAPAAIIAKDQTTPPLPVASVGAASTSVAETWALPGAIFVFAFAVAVHALVSVKTRRG